MSASLAGREEFDRHIILKSVWLVPANHLSKAVVKRGKKLTWINNLNNPEVIASWALNVTISHLLRDSLKILLYSHGTKTGYLSWSEISRENLIIIFLENSIIAVHIICAHF